MTDLLRTKLKDASQEVTQVDLHDRVLAASRRASRRDRRLSLVALALVAIAVTTVFTTLPDRNAARPPTDPTPTIGSTVSPEPLPTPDLHPTAAGPWSNEADPPADTSLDAMPLVVPEWPGADPARSCGGAVTLTGGAFVSPTRAAYRQLRLIRAVAGEVGGSAAVVALFYCHLGDEGRQFQVVAYRRDAHDRLVVLGQVLVSRPEGVPAMFNVDVAGDEVRVEVGDWAGSLTVNEANHFSVHQWRSYRWSGTAFQQSGGPTTFVGNPNFYDLAVTATDLRFGPVRDGVRYATMRVTVRNRGHGVAPKATVQVQLWNPLAWRGQGTTACPGGQWTTQTQLGSEYHDCVIGRLAPQATVELVISVSLNPAEQPADLATRSSSVFVITDQDDPVSRADNGTEPNYVAYYHISVT
jgi:hypothetical protein